MIRRAYASWGQYAWSGPLFYYQGRDDNNGPEGFERSFGLARVDFSRKPAFGAYQQAALAV